MAKRNIITIATGKKLYVNLAVNLVRSFYLTNNKSDIGFYVVTDSTDLFPVDVAEKIKVIPILPGELGEGFSPKLYLDRLVPDGYTLFIDSDCLVFRNIDFIFEAFKGKTVSVVGGYIAKGDWFGDVEAVCSRFQISHLPKFNGGIYYVEKGIKATEVFETARKLEKQYDEIGFMRLRGRPNDEVLMAVAMELHHQTPVPEDGKIMGEFVNFKSGFEGDIFKQKAVLFNTPTHKQYEESWPLTIGKPAIVHFLGDYNTKFPYTLFEKQLKLVQHNLPVPVIRAATFLIVAMPAFFKNYSKKVLRPVYRRVIGVRAIKKSERVIEI